MGKHASASSKDEHPSPEDITEELKRFFTVEHDDGGKQVKAGELLNLRPEVIATGKHFRTRLTEVKKLQQFICTSFPSTGDDLTCQNREPTTQDAPELALGVFALKVFKKSEVIRLKHVDHVRSEVTILKQLTYPFIITLYHHYQDEAKLYLLTEFVQLGTLGTHIERNSQLPNETARFYAAQIVMAVQYLHSEHIVPLPQPVECVDRPAGLHQAGRLFILQGPQP